MDSSNRLAVGEDISTCSVPDAQHWSDFYRERSSFQETVSRLKHQVRGFSGDRRTEAVRLALPGLIADSEGFERRFAFWEVRLGQLSQV
ncbi:MAG: hypothetical protein M3Z28_00425 [Candidatus Dormibacteraeota bacterium]|nr:hypothetical protein [Candidatus Dormibacteraeota bacterium]